MFSRLERLLSPSRKKPLTGVQRRGREEGRLQALLQERRGRAHSPCAFAVLGLVCGVALLTGIGSPAGDAVTGASLSSVGSLGANLVLGPNGRLGAAVSGNEPTHSWVVDGAVYAIAMRGTDVVVGGSFSLIGGATGSWAAIASTGRIISSPVQLGQDVSTAVSDGAKGWFVVTVDENDETSLLHLRADGTFDPRWKVAVNGSVYALARRGGTLFVAGDFTKIGGEAHARLVAIDVAKRKPLAWDARVRAKKRQYASVNVLELSSDRRTLYFAGEFAFVGGKPREGLAAVDVTTAKLTEWAPETDGDVYDLAAAPGGRRVYIAGDYSQLDDRDRAELGAVTTKRGALTDWNPKANGAIDTVVPALGGSPVYVGGTFTSVGGKSRRGMAALSARSGGATAWDANVNGAVDAIVVTQKTIYFGGKFDKVGGHARSNLGAAAVGSGALTGWDPRADAAVAVLAQGAVAGRILVGGAFRTVGALRREGIAALSPDGSRVLPWSPPVAGTVRTLAYAPQSGNLYFGGRFRFGSDPALHSLGLVAPDGGTRLWGGEFNSFVSALALTPDEQILYAGGAFSSVQGKTRKRLAALDANGLLSSWNSGANALVSQLVLDGDQLFVAGNFTSIGGATRRGLAVLDTATGLGTGWDAGLDGNVSALALSSDVLYIGGNFENVGTKARNYLASVLAETGTPTNWDPDPDNSVYALGLNPAATLLYAGGAFENIGRSVRDAAMFDTSAGFLLGWRPNAPFEQYALTTSRDGSTLYLGGDGRLDVFR